MSNVVPFKRSTRRRRCGKCNLKSKHSNAKSAVSSQIVKQTVDAANVFQLLAIENRYALETLERLGREMLAETRARAAR